MLTRLKVNGFKNLVDVDVRFGPFTCIAGENGVGKSNLFDAIRFLSALADHPFVEASRAVRDESGRTGDVRALFRRCGEVTADLLEFEAEMIVPPTGTDDLGQAAEAAATFLRYSLQFRPSDEASGTLELLSEELTDIKAAETAEALLFPMSERWRKSAVKFSRRGSPFISTDGAGERLIIKLHQENRQGRTARHAAPKLPRTVLSATTASESPTALLARREMQSWRRLQLEPTALRKPDEFSAQARLGTDGSHLPATLYRLAKAGKTAPGGTVYEQVAHRLNQLIRDVKEVHIDRDDKRELLSLILTDREETPFPARALSDGTLRFLALTVLELDPDTQGLICFEEPENGIHPERIPAMIRLLKDIATSTQRPVAADNPLRQVIVNTHSPGVVAEVEDADLLWASSVSVPRPGRRQRLLGLRFLEDTWRAQGWDPTRGRLPTISRGELLTYLWSFERDGRTGGKSVPPKNGSFPRPRKIIDRYARDLFSDLEQPK